MKTITRDQLRRLVPTIEDPEFDCVVRRLDLFPGKSDAIWDEPGALYAEAALFTYEWLRHLGIFAPQVAEEIVREITPTLLNWSKTVGKEVFLLRVVERRWVSWADGKSWYDSVSASRVDSLPEEPATVFLWLMNAGIRRKEAWAAKEGITDGNRPGEGGAVPALPDDAAPAEARSGDRPCAPSIA